MIWSQWWIWIAGGLVLAILEMIVPGYILLGFAVGASAVGVLLLLGANLTLPWLIAIFAVISLIAWLVMRRVFGLKSGQAKIWDTDINDH